MSTFESEADIPERVRFCPNILVGKRLTYR